MVARKAASTTPEPIEVPETEIETVQFGVVGLTPIIHNRMSEKAKRELLFPKGRKNAAERASTMKHDPVAEFRASPYRLPDPYGDAPTELALPASMFKGAMMTAALDLPGSSKAQVGRLIWLEGGFYLPLWGDIKLHMAITRSADAAHTPDVRTRSISPEWATVITVAFVRPLISPNTVVNLLTTGGRSSGVGDWRPQKGKGTFGQFRVVDIDDPELARVQRLGKDYQIAALENAEPYDDEALELLDWFADERKVRGR